jgi:hypothetical protein
MVSSNLLERELILVDTKFLACLVPYFRQVLGGRRRNLESPRVRVEYYDVRHYARMSL